MKIIKIQPYMFAIFIMIMIVCIAIPSGTYFHRCSQPTYGINPGDCIDDYIVKSTIDDRRLYAYKYDDKYNIYIITITIKDIEFTELYSTKPLEWCNIESVSPVA